MASATALDENLLAKRIRSCGDLRDLCAAREIHGLVRSSSFAGSRYLGNLLVEMYGKCHAVEDARRTFAEILYPNVFSWNLMVKVFIDHGELQCAKELFGKMPETDVVSWTTLITANAQAGDVTSARILFDQSPCSNVVTWTSMTAAYAQAREVNQCRDLFKSMPQRDIVSWNSMIQALVQDGLVEEAVELFETMPEHSIVSCNILIAALGKHNQIGLAINIFDRMRKRDIFSWLYILRAYISVDLAQSEILLSKMPEHSQEMYDMLVITYVSNNNIQKIIDLLRNFDHGWHILIRELSKAGRLHDARLVFNEVANPDLLTWTSIITAYVQEGYTEESWNLFYNKMPHWDSLVCTLILQTLSNIDRAKELFDMISELDIISFTTMLTLYTQNNQLEKAKLLFEDMPVHNSVSSNVIMRAYSQLGNLQEAKEIFDKMPHRTIFSWNTMLKGYVQSGDLVEAEMMFDKIPEPDLVSVTTMIEAFANSIELERSCCLFDRLKEHDQVCSTAMIGAYSLHGHVDSAIETYNYIPSHHIDVVSNTAMLMAYAENGHLLESKGIFDTMPEKNLIVWNTMLAAYSHVGNIHEATKLFTTMPRIDTISWNTIINTNAQAGNSIQALDLVPVMAINGLDPDGQTYSSVLHACNHGGKSCIGQKHFTLLQNACGALFLHGGHSLPVRTAQRCRGSSPHNAVHSHRRGVDGAASGVQDNRRRQASGICRNIFRRAGATSVRGIRSAVQRVRRAYGNGAKLGFIRCEKEDWDAIRGGGLGGAGKSSSMAATERAMNDDPDDVHITSTLSFQQDQNDNSQDNAKISNTSSPSPVLQPIKDPNTDIKDESDSRKLEMLKLLQSGECIKLEPLVLDKDSFAETAANISTLSVLVKDGLAQVRLASDQSYIIVPADSALTSDDTKSIFQLNYKDWELMRETSMTTTNQNPSAWPTLIPKGIRTKSRRRACFERDRIESDLTSSVENRDPIDRDPGAAIDLEDSEIKPRKPLLTYSRRKKPAMESDSKETLVKRYTRRLLNGKLLVEKTIVFQELVPATTTKIKQDGDGLFEKLARAPKRRRTGNGEAHQSGLYTPVSKPSGGCTLAVYSNQGVENSDAMIITPKRFKKSSFRPRQVAIAQIKAKLKAILNRQAPLK